MQNILIIGATSAIAEAAARHWAARGDALFLLGRNATRLTAIAADLRARGATTVDSEVFDANDIDGMSTLLDRAHATLGGVDVVLLAYGSLPSQPDCNHSANDTRVAFMTNATSVLELMTLVAQRLETQGRGALAVISSVAGDRGRASNAIYGAAKAAVTTYASALRQRLFRSGVNVLTIKPGLVDTPMTAGFIKGPLWSSAHRVGAGIVQAIDRRRSVIYLPWFWQPIMALIRLVPESLFRRLRF